MIKIWKCYFSEPLAWGRGYTALSRNLLHLGTAGIILNLFFPAYFWTLVFSWDFAFLDIPKSLSGAPEFAYIEGVYKYKYGGKSSWPAVCIESTATRKIIDCAPRRVLIHGLIGQQGKPAQGYSYPQIGLIELVVDGHAAISANEAQNFFQSEIYKSIGLILWTVAMYGLAFARQYQLVSTNENRACKK